MHSKLTVKHQSCWWRKQKQEKEASLPRFSLDVRITMPHLYICHQHPNHCFSATKIELSLRYSISQFIWPVIIYGLKFFIIFYVLYLNQLNRLKFISKISGRILRMFMNPRLYSTVQFSIVFCSHADHLIAYKEMSSHHFCWVVKTVISTCLEFSTLPKTHLLKVYTVIHLH